MAYKYHMGWSSVHYDSHEFKGTPENIKKAGCDDFVIGNRVNHNPKVPDRGDGKPMELGRQMVFTTAIEASGFVFNDEDELKKLKADEKISMSKFKSGFTLSDTTDNIVNAIDKNTVTVHDDSPFYISTCKKDRLGCVRISYNKSSATHISVIGFTGASGVMEPWNVKKQTAEYPMQSSYDCEVTPFIRMLPEELTKSEMIAHLRGENFLQTWGLRVGGMIAAWFGCYCLFDPFASYSDRMAEFLAWIPVFGPAFGKSVEGIVEMFVCLVTCSLGMGCGMMSAGLVWAGLRPIIGGPLCAGGVAMCCIGYCAMWKAWRDPRKFHYDHGKAQQQSFAQHPGAPIPWGEQFAQPMMKGGPPRGKGGYGEMPPQGPPGPEEW